MMQTQLRDDQRTAYRENGYLILDSCVSADEIGRVKGIVERLFQIRAGRHNGDFLDLAGTDDDSEEATLPQILMPVKYSPELAECALREAALRIARDLLGDFVHCEGEHAIMKPRLGGAETPFHQDEAFWSDLTEYDSLSVWFPLQDVAEDNGCMRFVTRSHLLGVLPHRSVYGDIRRNGLEIQDSTEFSWVSASLKVGGATVHHCRTVHGAGPNRTEHDRFAYIFGFGLPARRATVGRDFYWLREKQLQREERARREGFALTKMRPEL